MLVEPGGVTLCEGCWSAVSGLDVADPLALGAESGGDVGLGEVEGKSALAERWPRCCRWLRVGEVSVDLAGDVTLEASDDLAS